MCTRTNQLVGFEDLEIPDSILEVINPEENQQNQIVKDETLEENMDNEWSSDEDSTFSDSDSGLDNMSCKPMATTILQFFWSSIEGDFTWPVASFPVNNLNAKTIGHCVWSAIRILSELQFGKDGENKVQVLYGVCDGATHSSAFFNKHGSTNWMTENPYNNNNPIFWLSDPPHMIKKLRNFIISQNRNLRYNDYEISLEHLTDVVERGLTKLSSKHLFLNSRTKMSVKRAAETCCKEVADDILFHSKHGFQKTLMTRKYIRKAAEYFKIMNSISLEPDTIHKLVKILVFFKKWFTEVSGGVKDHRGALKEHWKKFISRQTYHDLIRSIRGFIGLVSYVKMNHPLAAVVPRTTNQDDVENYFSLQRSKIAGGESTVQQYMEGNSSLATTLLIKAEKKELNNNSYVGSYAAFSTPNFVSVPLKRKKKSTSQHSSDVKSPPKSYNNLVGCSNSFNKCDVDAFHTQRDEQQLYRQAGQVLDLITIKSSSTIISNTLKLVSILREKQNKQNLLNFLKTFNYKLRHQHLIQGKWHKDILNDTLTAIHQDKELQRCWQTLVQNVSTKGHKVLNVDNPSSEIFRMFCGKFGKRRCVTYLAVDELNPKSEEQKSAIRQMLRSLEKATTKQQVKNVKATDKCFKCGEMGHWASQCKKDIPHDPAWLQKQHCYACGQKGHLKADCSLRTTSSYTKKVTSTCELNKNKDTNNDPLTIQLLRLPEVELKGHPKLYNLPSMEASGKHLDERFIQQGSATWKQARKGKINGSKAASALGWRGRQEMIDYSQEIKSGQVTSNINDAMRWGSMCEDHAIATYIQHMPCRKFERTGLWITTDEKGSSWLAVSPDGIVDTDTVIEIKCPYMGGNPFPYRKVPVLYVPQCQLEMYATNTDKCHFVCWTPRKTVVYLIKRDQQFLQELLCQLKFFWNEANEGKIPGSHINLDNLKKRAQQISDQSAIIKTLPSCRKENAMQDSDFDQFWKKTEAAPTQKCNGCGKLKVICNINPCEQNLHLRRRKNATLNTFQSYTYASGQVANSCHTDTFLEAIYHPFTRQITPATVNFLHTSPAMDALLESIVLREQGKFHHSKMVLWNYLSNHTANGQTTFPIGEMAAISNIFNALCTNMYEEEKRILFIKESVNVKCSRNCTHSTTRQNTYSAYFLHYTYININDIVSSAYNPILVSQKLLTQLDTTCHTHRSFCLQQNKDGSNCDGQLVRTSHTINSPLLLAIELDKNEGRSVQPALPEKLQFNLGANKYDLAAIIYHHNNHFWCEVFVSLKGHKSGWYLYNDMCNSGKAEFIGKHPQVKHSSYMYILLFEKNQANVTTSWSKDNSSIANILSLAHQYNVISDTRQVKENYSAILKFCEISFPPTIPCKEMKAQVLETESEILTSLKGKCVEQKDGAAVKRRNENQNLAGVPRKVKREM